MNVAATASRHLPAMRALSDLGGQTRLARLAGLLYLALAVLTGFANAAAAGLHVPGDPAATAARLVADPAFVRVAVVAALAGGTAWVLLVLALGGLLREADRGAARALVVFSSLGAGILMLSAVLELAAMRVATGGIDFSPLGPAGSNAAVALLMDMHAHGVLVAAVFMGLWLFPLGVLVVRSGGMLPGWIGRLLVVGGACYLANVLAAFLAPGLYAAIKGVILLVPTVPEVLMVGYLLVVGVRAPRSPAPAC